MKGSAVRIRASAFSLSGVVAATARGARELIPTVVGAFLELGNRSAGVSPKTAAVRRLSGLRPRSKTSLRLAPVPSAAIFVRTTPRMELDLEAMAERVKDSRERWRAASARLRSLRDGG